MSIQKKYLLTFIETLDFEYDRLILGDENKIIETLDDIAISEAENKIRYPSSKKKVSGVQLYEVTKIDAGEYLESSRIRGMNAVRDMVAKMKVVNIADKEKRYNLFLELKKEFDKDLM